jgi:hypothetical protein
MFLKYGGLPILANAQVISPAAYSTPQTTNGKDRRSLPELIAFLARRRGIADKLLDY